jgi:hypothetical protein
MPKLIRSRYSSGSQSSPSSPINVTSLASKGNNCVIPLCYYSPILPPWNTSTRRKVSDEDMHQYHVESDNGSCCGELSLVSTQMDQHNSLQLSNSSLSSSTNSTSMASLKRRKPSVCLAALVEQQQSPSGIQIRRNRQRVVSPSNIVKSCEASPSIPCTDNCWGQFTFDESLTDKDMVTSRRREDTDHKVSWDYHTEANTTSFIPTIIQPCSPKRLWTTTPSSSSHGAIVTTATSWKDALLSTSSSYPHHTKYVSYHPYHERSRRTRILSPQRPLQFRSRGQQQTHHNGKGNLLQQDQPYMIQSLSSSSSSFEDFILNFPSNDTDEIDTTAQTLSMMGL